MYCYHVLLKFIFCIVICSLVNAQVAYQNATTVPYPYQAILGVPPGPPNIQPYPYGGYGYPVVTPNHTQIANNYYASLALQGRPAYQYPLPYPQPGTGYPQPAYGYPPINGYPPQGFGYPQTYQTLGGYGYPYYFGQGMPYYQQQGPRQQTSNNVVGNPDVKAEVIDVSPEYHRQVLGWGPENSATAADGNTNQIYQPKYNVQVESETSNFTNIPQNLSKPIITTKQFTTSIRRTFVYDSSKPGKPEAINLHFVNGQQVTTAPPPTTTENEDVDDIKSKVTPKGRRFMDVPSSCPKGQLLSHNGKCIAPFTLGMLSIKNNDTQEVTTQGPEQDENEILEE